MTEVITKPIPVNACKYAIERQAFVRPIVLDSLPEPKGTALYDFDSFQSAAQASRLRRGLQGVVMTGLALVLCRSQAEAEDERSRPVAMSAIEGLKLLTAQKTKYPKVDFHDPLRFSWSRDDDRISRAAKCYLENTNADY